MGLQVEQRRVPATTPLGAFPERRRRPKQIEDPGQPLQWQWEVRVAAEGGREVEEADPRAVAQQEVVERRLLVQ